MASAPTAMAQAMTGRQLGLNTGMDTAPAVNSGANAAPPASGQGSGLVLPGPGNGIFVPAPPIPAAPFTGNAPQTANASAGAGAGTGLIGTASHLVSTLGNVVRSILSPPVATPPVAPPASSGNASTAPTGVGSVPQSVANAATQVVRTVANALPTTAPSSAQPLNAQSAGALQPQAASMSQAPAGLQASAQTAQQTAAQPQATTQQPAPANAQASQAPPAQPAQAQRADAAFAPPGNTAADRAALPQQAQAPMQPGVPSAPQGATLVAAVPLATTVAQAPVAQQLAGNPQAQATGNPLAGTAALDAGSPARAELTGTGTYTAEGPGLRRRERMKVGARQMGQWMLAAAQGRLHLVRPHDDSRHEAERVFQWLFWVLAIVAYGSLGLVLVAFLLSFGELPAAPTLRRWTGEFAFAGLLAAVGAWWLGRQLTRAARPPPDPIRR